ncbi:MAG: class I SAM-dependent methyltransferase [candidate division Zixibacteria bacterium]|nr:class I SAM-dependent methyltransferase [candidate division Zixibacteria bacterium]
MAALNLTKPEPTVSADVLSSFRKVDPAQYPELANYMWDDVYGKGDKMAPGALYLAMEMTRRMNMIPGSQVLDLACGKGVTSEFLARTFDVKVAAVDLWITEEFLRSKFESAGLGHKIRAYKLDVTEPLPFADEQFDSIFCMQAFHSFGGSVTFVHQLLRHLKSGGQICIAGTCFNEEFPNVQQSQIFSITNGWDAEYDKYHSPIWWRSLFEATELVEVSHCQELDNGLEMWEDVILYEWQRSEFSLDWLRESQWLINHVAHSRHHQPYLTHFVISAEKRNRHGAMDQFQQ